MREQVASLCALLLIAIFVFNFRTSDKPCSKTEEPVTAISSEPVDTSGTQEIIYFPVPLSKELQIFAEKQCEEASPPVPIEVVLAVIEHESGFDPAAINLNANGTQDYGLMQINDSALPWVSDNLGVTNIIDPQQNIQAGVGILSYHLSYSEEIGRALVAYQCGEGSAREKFSIGITETEFSREIIERSIELAAKRSGNAG